ncbi:MAG: hypothetical protein A2W25_06030 [candidate division Zixibacteria bacterium RBG_16_53_22]|nr:MAG: hypothetical protein A2W25_06030 [candidate division Zixibacteria bacterium RBG_16_53_22]
MNSDWLLKNFEQISEAPDAIPRLRRFILDLAVRGKLVEQNPDDEPAVELLKRIEAEKERLSKAGELRKHHTQPLDKEQIAFTIPSAWSWTHLAQIGIINPQNDSEDNAEASFVPMRMIYAEYRQPSEHEIRPWGEIRRGFTHFADGDVGLAKITPCFENGKSTVFRNLTGGIGAGTTELHIVRPIFVVADYILIFLKSSHFIEAGIPKMTGTAGQKRVPKDYFAFSPFPLPPLAEQHRIVAKVDELMALCDKLEAAQAKRERRRDRLVAATLRGLDNGDDSSEPGGHPTLEESARFYFNHLPHLTTHPEHIQQLRQTILNLAVRGQLAPRIVSEGTAESVIEEINSARKKLLAEGKIGRYLPLSPVNGDEVLFAIPSEWRWMRLGDITFCRDGERIPVSREERQHRQGPFDYYGASGVIDKIDAFLFDKPLLLIGEDGANLINRSTPIAFIARGQFWVNNHAHVLDGISEGFLRYVEVFINATDLKPYVTGTAQPKMNQAKMNSIPVALPPLAEQHRIVAKVVELMALCGELEARLTTTATTRRQYLEATISEALAP